VIGVSRGTLCFFYKYKALHFEICVFILCILKEVPILTQRGKSTKFKAHGKIVIPKVIAQRASKNKA
jgi:hypothetical protein